MARSTLARSVGTHADVVPQAFLSVFRSVDIWWSGDAGGQADSLPALVAAMLLGGAGNLACSRLSGGAWCGRILISSRRDAPWWDRRFRLSPPAVAGVWLRLMLLLYYSSQLAKNGSYRGVRTLACNVGTRADVVAQAFLPVFWREGS